MFTTRCLHVLHDVRDPSGESGNCGRECCPVILPKWRLPRHLHGANLRHGTDGFTSPPKDFFALKNPRIWVLKASTLPLDHRSRYVNIRTLTKYIEINLSVSNLTFYRIKRSFLSQDKDAVISASTVTKILKKMMKRRRRRRKNKNKNKRKNRFQDCKVFALWQTIYCSTNCKIYSAINKLLLLQEHCY